MRPSIEHTWLQVAGIVATRGTCSRLYVGAVIARAGRIISTGWNGAPQGLPHCEHDPDENLIHCLRVIHAERNAVGFAARFGISTDGATMYCTHVPCSECATVLIAAGLERVVYANEYKSTLGAEMLREAGIFVKRMEV